MSVGEKGTLHCEPASAYGDAGAPPQGIPGDTAIEFDMELVSAEKAEPDLSQASQASAGVEDMFPSLDIDKNGSLDASELGVAKFMSVMAHRGSSKQPSAEDLMLEMDINRDGGVDDNEYLAFVWREQAEGESKRVFREHDKDGDGKMSIVEYIQCPHAYQSIGNKKMMEIRAQAESANKPDLGALYKKHFDGVDANKDGHIAQSEYVVADADWLTKADTNGDGKASRAEWTKFREEINHVVDANEDTFTDENFGKLDKDQDGVLTPMEYHKGMMQMAADLMAQGYGGADL